MPFQKITRFPINDAMWFKLCTINDRHSVCFLYSNVTYTNVIPATYAVCASKYDNLNIVDCKLIAGESGSTYGNNIKYKIENDALHFWVRGSMVFPSTLVVLTGDLSIDGTIENPPSDATQPSF